MERERWGRVGWKGVGDADRRGKGAWERERRREGAVEWDGERREKGQWEREQRVQGGRVMREWRRREREQRRLREGAG